ncbi:MAG: HAMP domain-containing histidine kinase [Clostridia bacterium]|nr:HAMP domain-containing histidine kinase [Clostridia bacterium]
MLKKLRTKFIVINMALVCGVLLTVLLFGFISTFQMKKTELYLSLDKALELTVMKTGHGDRDHNKPLQPGQTGPDGENPEKTFGSFQTAPGTESDKKADDFSGAQREPLGGRPENMMPELGRDDMPQIYAFTVTVNASGEIINTYALNSEMDEELLSSAAADAIASGKERGSLKQQGLLYKILPSENKTVIAFTSVAGFRSWEIQTAVLYILIFTVGSLLLLAVSFLLSGIALRPVKAAWDSQKQFVADASHDLKTPLTVILANNNILKSHAGDTVDSQMKWIESTDEEATRMKNLAEKLLELSGAEQMGDKIELTDTDMTDLIDGISMQFEPVAFESGVALDTDTDSGVRVKSNADALSRIAHVLIDNAIKYSAKGERVLIELKKERNGVRFSVTNKGTVISAEDLAHVFERFYRADKVRDVGGHGLGLAIAKKLSESIKAELTASSDAAHGTVFVLTIPSKLVE